MIQIALDRTPAQATIALRGELDTQAAQELDARLEALVPDLPPEVVVDLAQLDYLNSTGIRSFIRLDKLLKPQGKRFAFAHAAPRIVRIFRYCGLHAYFTFLAAPAPATPNA